jgi:predicted nucleic acid-binding protein
LRGYDAVHLAAAERIGDATTVLVAGDRRLCDAALALGLQVSQLTAP